LAFRLIYPPALGEGLRRFSLNRRKVANHDETPEKNAHPKMGKLDGSSLRTSELPLRRMVNLATRWFVWED